MQNFLASLSASGVSAALLATFVAVSALALTAQPALIDRCLLRPYWLVRRRQWATLATCGFVHADWMHLLFNAFTFWAFAFPLERRIGPARLAALYACALLLSSLGTWVQHRREPGYASLGASGAVLGVVFASIVYFPGATLFILPLPVPIPAPLFAVGYLAFSVWASRRGGGRINHDAHLVGAVVGLVFVLLTDPATVRAALLGLSRALGGAAA